MLKRDMAWRSVHEPVAVDRTFVDPIKNTGIRKQKERVENGIKSERSEVGTEALLG